MPAAGVGPGEFPDEPPVPAGSLPAVAPATDLLQLLRDLRSDGRTVPEFRMKLRPNSEGEDVLQLTLIDQDFIEQLELPLKTVDEQEGRLFGEVERLVRRRQVLRAP